MLRPQCSPIGRPRYPTLRLRISATGPRVRWFGQQKSQDLANAQLDDTTLSADVAAIFKPNHDYALIVGLDARTKGPSPLVGESDVSPESELSPKLRVLLLKFWIQIFCYNI
jgi:hypothetical protein